MLTSTAGCLEFAAHVVIVFLEGGGAIRSEWLFCEVVGCGQHGS